MVCIYWLYRWGDRKVYGRPGVARWVQMTDTENRGGPRNNWSAAILRVFTRLESLMGIMPRQAVSETGSADSLGSLSTETITGVDASVAVGGHYPANDGPDVAEIEAQEVINENLFLDDFLQSILRAEFRPPCQRWCHSYKGLGSRGWICPGYAPGLNAEKFAPADVG